MNKKISVPEVKTLVLMEGYGMKESISAAVVLVVAGIFVFCLTWLSRGG